ncbi:electron transfer flavoprotein subunit alpha/FixB family protein [Paradesulfitobacterium ferrireducens]|uniref:electron transfer flavoprotein subunit alpha/FixB family protein n=1 Tax=Paradesulfitobacterium ferrireducens TaxID=2816476 RepID=UPI001A8DDA1A|nr:electron transfer flavoprotein subunit alpha/FixB family protein [Paradesulfitobacterium ferrireducens]
MQIWVVVEGDDHGLRESSREVLTAATTVAGGVLAAAVVLAPDKENLVQEVMEFGPQTIYLHEEGSPSVTGEDYAEFLGELIERERPGLVLAAETQFGKGLLSRTALQYRMPIFPDCLGISQGPESLLFERLWYGERVSALLTSAAERPVLATWREGIVNVKKCPGLNSTVQKVRPQVQTLNLTRFLEEVKADPLTVDLSEAEVIVAGGGGMGSAAGFQLIQELAELIGAAVGGSRVARDNGWIPLKRQIGQTGKTVAPRLIISCGISGATQHTFGMRDAKKIIAINKDKNAPIFKIADAGIVGDVHEVLPELIKRIKEGKQNARPVGA